MKKRVLMLAMLAALVLSFGIASAEADYYFKIDDVKVDDIYDGTANINKDVTVSFYVTVSGKASLTTGETGYYKNANVVKWTVAGAATGDGSEVFTVKSTTVTNMDANGQNAANQSYYRFAKGIDPQDNTAMGPTTLKIDVTGTLLKETGSMPVKVYLCNSDGTAAGQIITTDAAAVSAVEFSGSANESGNIAIHAEYDYANDSANPDSEAWDGKDPDFTSNPGINTEVKAKAKLTTTKLDDDFTSGSDGTQDFTITGPVTSIDVYVAKKDAIKLGWFAKNDSNARDVRLTKDNIKAFNIPFRITSYDFRGNAGILTGAKKTDKEAFNEDKKAAKEMTSKITLAFNGGYFSYKGFPLTIAVKNDQMPKKAAKTVKINVKPLDATPSWWFWDERDVTVRRSMTEEVDAGEIKLSDYSYLNNPAFSITDETGTITKDETDETGDTYTVTVADGNEKANVIVSYDVEITEEYQHVIDPKVKADKNIEIFVPLRGEAGEIGVFSENMFYISGDYGPFEITKKGEKNGVSADITKPVFNYRGELGRDNNGDTVTDGEGSVEIKGKLATITKETKTAITLTVTNPTTKKKAAAKVTVIGTVPASFDVKKYPISDDDNKWVKTKYVEIGKTPSVKVKAIGSKTIEYWVNDEQLEELNAIGLSFDNSKGSVVVFPKTAKKATKPTSYDEGDDGDYVFSPIELVIYAENKANDDPAEVYAMVGITGAKPKLSTKTINFTVDDYAKAESSPKDTYYPIEVKLGSAAPTYNDQTANVTFRLADEKDTTLSKLGLKLATWKDLPHYVSNDGEVVATNVKILDSGDTTTLFTLYYESDDEDGVPVKYVLPASTYTKKDETTGETLTDFTTTALPKYATAGENTYLSKGVHDDEEGDITGRNKGYIMVEDAGLMKETKKAKVNLIIENVGATNKGSITLNIAAKPTASANNSSSRVMANGTSETAAKNGHGGGASTTAPEGLELETESEAEDESDETTEAKLTTGDARTAADLTAAQQAFLAANGYKVIAVLPELKANVDGQQDIDVELDEDAPEGEEMIYIPFPKDAEESEDDNIVDFYDEAGAPVEGVPASHKIIASPWFREGVTYEPVIAIEAK